ncbi:MAG: TetR/AcrR family transcriptional regulator [Alphaproteobacteria bacterium]|nr:TetR/AcrR family transcriptional regulator [Alphaproteobacteria bacterium]
MREALIGAGIELLDEGGLGGLTLRRCAARAGVSHAAPAHHFAGLSGLLTAIVARGYKIFTRTMIAERSQAAADPRAQLVAICNGYLRFSEENGALFTLMFSTQNLDFDNPELATSSAAAYQVLADGCAPFRQGAAGSTGTEIMVWSLVHGFATLSRRNRPGQANRMNPELKFESILPDLELI